MKYIITLLFFAISHPVFAQYTFFEENMGSTSVGPYILPASIYAGYLNYGAVAYAATPTPSIASIRSDSSSSSGYSTASGGNFLFLVRETNSFFTIKNISILGATNVRVAFGVSKTSIAASDGSTLTVQVSVDGSEAISFSPSLPTEAGTTQWYYIVSPVSIPSGSSLSISFYVTVPSGAENYVGYRIDDIAVLSDTPLPVVFGDIAALLDGENLYASWTTLQEINNDYFEVQLSDDGKHFSTIATLKSKDGNSDRPQHYEVMAPLKQWKGLMVLPALLLSLCWGSRRSALAKMLTVILMGGLLGATACSKDSSAIDSVMDGKLFLRIKQVDVDGKYEYSKTIQVIR